MPNQLYGISISDYQNYGSVQNAGDQGYDLLQNHSPWSLCTGPRLTYFVAVIPTGIHIQGLCKGYASEYPQNMALYGTVPPFYAPEISSESMEDRWRTP